MRYLLAAALVICVGAPLEAQNSNGGCKDRCQANYSFCLTRAKTKKAKSSCKIDRKHCKSGCRG